VSEAFVGSLLVRYFEVVAPQQTFQSCGTLRQQIGAGEQAKAQPSPKWVALKPYSLPALQRALRGRWRGSAHPGDVGRAMRKLGFVRRRDWRGGEHGFRALWFPKAHQ
jgi:hypothetical protein